MTGAYGSLGALPPERPFEGVLRRSLDSAGATVASYAFEPHARFPLHRHPEEQITVVLEGEIECVFGGRRTRLAAGDWAVFAPHVEHAIQAGPEGARFLAIVVPRRASPGAYTMIEQN